MEFWVVFPPLLLSSFLVSGQKATKPPPKPKSEVLLSLVTRPKSLGFHKKKGKNSKSKAKLPGNLEQKNSEEIQKVGTKLNSPGNFPGLLSLWI